MDKTRYTDSHEHPLSWFKPVYELLTVTEDNYTEELDKGLYTFIQGVEIKSGYEKIKFTYYSPEGKILAIETVPVLYNGAKGDPGEQGEQGASYKGIGHDAIGTGIRTPWVEGDTYINAADGYLYTYDTAERLWKKIPSYSDSRYNQAINDMIALSNNTGYDAEFLNVINLWVRNLTAQTALINQLFTKKITLHDGGIFKSENYNGSANNMQLIDNIPEGTPVVLDKNGTEGFAVDSFGHLDVVDMNATGGTFNDVRITGSLNASHGIKYANNIIKRGSVKDTDNNPIFEFLLTVNSQLRAEMYGELACGGQIVFTIGNNTYYIYFHLARFYVSGLYISNYELSCNMAFGCVVTNFNYFTGYSNNPQVGPFNFSQFTIKASDIQGSEMITVNIGRNSYDETQIANIYLEMHY